MPELTIKEVADELGRTFEEFKTANDARLAALEKGGGVADLEEQLERINTNLSTLDQLKSDLDALAKKSLRPGAGGDTPDIAEHKTAFAAFVRKGAEAGLAELQKKALSIGVDDDGGYAVPEELDRNILQVERDAVPMRQVCSVITVGTEGYKRLVSVGGAGAGWVGESDARPETSTPQLAQIAATMGEVYAQPAATQRSLDDMFFNAEQWLADEVGRAFAEQENAAFVSGDGANKPIGILSGATAATGDDVRPFGTLQHVATGASGDFDADDLIDLIYALRSGYRQGAQWMCSGLTLAKIRKLKNSNGDLIWQPGLQAGQPSQLLGYGVTENEDWPAVAADSLAIGFGNWQRGYTVVDRVGTRVLRDPYTNKPNVLFYTTKRVGGMVTDTNAVKLLQLSA